MRAVCALVITMLLVPALLMPVAAPGKTINVRGEGVAKCSAWVDAHTRKTDRYPVQDSWLLGFVNAVSSMLDVPGVDDISAKFHNRDLVAWIDDYCSARPDEVLVHAADALMRELARLATEPSDSTPPTERRH